MYLTSCVEFALHLYLNPTFNSNPTPIEPSCIFIWYHTFIPTAYLQFAFHFYMNHRRSEDGDEFHRTKSVFS